MYNLPNLFRFSPKKWGPSCLKDACGFVNTNICKKCLSNFFKLFFKKQCFKKSNLNTTDGESSGPKPSFSRKWGIGKLNQTDGEKGFLKWGIYIGATHCKNLADMKKQQENIDWGPKNHPTHTPASSQRLNK